MINYLNNKIESNLMKFALLMITMILFLPTVFSAEGNILLDYTFEEGIGSITFDQSGNDFDGLLTATSWTTDKQFGTYALYFNGISSQVSANSGNTIPQNFTISFWTKCTSDSDPAVYYTIYDIDQDHFGLGYDVDGGNDITFFYQDTGLTYRYIHFDTSNKCSEVTYENYLLTYSHDLKEVKFYRDGLLTDTVDVSTNPPVIDVTDKFLKIGVNSASANDFFDGFIDDFRFYDFILNQTQINQIQTNSIVDGVSDNTGTGNGNDDSLSQTPINNLVIADIINTLSPQNTSTNTLVTIDATLNYQSSCEIYLDNNLYSTYDNILAFSQELPPLDVGQHQYFVYCSYLNVVNNTLYYEISDTYYLNITPKDPNQIFFQIVGNDYNVNDLDLFMTTPCLEEGYSAIGTDFTPYRPKYNPDGAYFSYVINGYASFNLTPDKHEFCLYNGGVIVNEYGKTNNYDFYQYLGHIDLGEVEIPNNISTTFQIKNDLIEIYDVKNPKAWGLTWVGVIGGIILFIFGAITVFAGVYAKEGKIVIAGVFLIMSAFGVTIPSILLAV